MAPRFIPAHAGNRRLRKLAAAAHAVHPRARGEQASHCTPFIAATVHPRARGEQNAGRGALHRAGGSSPRTRGTAKKVNCGIGPLRFIPAHAGNRFEGSTVKALGPVHPRARGEQCGRRSRKLGGGGSSPRTRGTGARQSRPSERRRFIPAHAGNRFAGPYRLAHTPVHPRARGEQQRPETSAKFSGGSSPRTRGTEPLSATPQVDRRFIPAHAGNRWN